MSRTDRDLGHARVDWLLWIGWNTLSWQDLDLHHSSISPPYRDKQDPLLGNSMNSAIHPLLLQLMVELATWVIAHMHFKKDSRQSHRLNTWSQEVCIYYSVFHYCVISMRELIRREIITGRQSNMITRRLYMLLWIALPIVLWTESDVDR